MWGARIGAEEPAGSKRPRIGTRNCRELRSGASDREIYGGEGSVTGGELPLPQPASGLGSFRDLGLHASRALASWRGRERGALSPGFVVCVCFLGFVKPPPRLRDRGPRSYVEWRGRRARNEDGTQCWLICLSQANACQAKDQPQTVKIKQAKDPAPNDWERCLDQAAFRPRKPVNISYGY